MPHHDTSRRAGTTVPVAHSTLDRILELFERRRLSPTELRVLVALIDRGAGASELAEALDLSLDEITRAGRNLAARGLIRWRDMGSREQTRFDITSFGLTTVRALLTAIDTTADADRPQPAVRLRAAA